ncbi:MAG: hypothetical protein IKE09_02255 [Clostridiales bacterium]|nr:hypothetical protein [Clostridiales bacterium]
MNILTGSELIGNYPVGDMLTLLALTVVVVSGIFFGGKCWKNGSRIFT